MFDNMSAFQMSVFAAQASVESDLGISRKHVLWRSSLNLQTPKSKPSTSAPKVDPNSPQDLPISPKIAPP